MSPTIGLPAGPAAVEAPSPTPEAPSPITAPAAGSAAAASTAAAPGVGDAASGVGDGALTAAAAGDGDSMDVDDKKKTKDSKKRERSPKSAAKDEGAASSKDNPPTASSPASKRRGSSKAADKERGSAERSEKAGSAVAASGIAAAAAAPVADEATVTLLKSELKKMLEWGWASSNLTLVNDYNRLRDEYKAVYTNDIMNINEQFDTLTRIRVELANIMTQHTEANSRHIMEHAMMMVCAKGNAAPLSGYNFKDGDLTFKPSNNNPTSFTAFVQVVDAASQVEKTVVCKIKLVKKGAYNEIAHALNNHRKFAETVLADWNKNQLVGKRLKLNNVKFEFPTMLQTWQELPANYHPPYLVNQVLIVAFLECHDIVDMDLPVIVKDDTEFKAAVTSNARTINADAMVAQTQTNELCTTINGWNPTPPVSAECPLWTFAFAFVSACVQMISTVHYYQEQRVCCTNVGPNHIKLVRTTTPTIMIFSPENWVILYLQKPGTPSYPGKFHLEFPLMGFYAWPLSPKVCDNLCKRDIGKETYNPVQLAGAPPWDEGAVGPLDIMLRLASAHTLFALFDNKSISTSDHIEVLVNNNRSDLMQFTWMYAASVYFPYQNKGMRPQWKGVFRYIDLFSHNIFKAIDNERMQETKFKELRAPFTNQTPEQPCVHGAWASCEEYNGPAGAEVDADYLNAIVDFIKTAGCQILGWVDADKEEAMRKLLGLTSDWTWSNKIWHQQKLTFAGHKAPCTVIYRPCFDNSQWVSLHVVTQAMGKRTGYAAGIKKALENCLDTLYRCGYYYTGEWMVIRPAFSNAELNRIANSDNKDAGPNPKMPYTEWIIVPKTLQDLILCPRGAAKDTYIRNKVMVHSQIYRTTKRVHANLEPMTWMPIPFDDKRADMVLLWHTLAMAQYHYTCESPATGSGEPIRGQNWMECIMNRGRLGLNNQLQPQTGLKHGLLSDKQCRAGKSYTDNLIFYFQITSHGQKDVTTKDLDGEYVQDTFEEAGELGGGAPSARLGAVAGRGFFDLAPDQVTLLIVLSSPAESQTQRSVISIAELALRTSYSMSQTFPITPS